MRIHTPSPAMCVAITALVFAMTGTGIAAVNYANNAGAVDGKSAVSATASLKSSKGKLIAAASGGTESGRIPGKFISDVAKAERFAVSNAVPDNGVSQQFLVADEGSTGGLGKIRATCQDQDPAPGVEDPSSVFSFQNSSGKPLNFARRTGNNPGSFVLQQPGAGDAVTVNGSTTVTYNIQQEGINVVVDAVIRQDGRGTGAALCTVYGTITTTF